jgi:hypothetical protein
MLHNWRGFRELRSNPELAQLVLQTLPSLKSLFAINNLIELHRSALIIRR